ncbi:hypothetical protein WPS_22830 [Vulcanimicrobium alpinum]|uniref:TadE-like domain-containing protein n=1 Tax=Vulcanimicrobium alpinum TaxID=3016050 RepID=A0AAN1XX60_UNVUL|nr:TadE/TadG family type IV pilus assembly protein [Vulcanimicrobium alpinum]BDE07007.1 hypothetical protein WPS_22830 [Vulcanimicrobium alpinum]
MTFSRGTVLAEFALASVVSFTLLFGIIDFGRALYTYHLVTEAARLGTRYAIVNGATACTGATSPDPMQAFVSGQAPGITASQMTVTTTCATQNGCTSTTTNPPRGCTVTISVTYPFHFLIPLVSTLVPSMRTSSTMTIAN